MSDKSSFFTHSDEDKLVGRTSPGCIRWLHTVTGYLARPISGGSSAKVGTEIEWVELSGTQIEHMSFIWAKMHIKLWEKIQNLPVSSTPFNLQMKVEQKAEVRVLNKNKERRSHLTFSLATLIAFQDLVVTDNSLEKWSCKRFGIKRDHRPFNSMWLRSQPEIIEKVPVGGLD